jgi:hypothetical protein
MIVLYVFGIPIVAFIVLRNNRTELHDIATRRKYSFLYAVRIIYICKQALCYIREFVVSLTLKL